MTVAATVAATTAAATVAETAEPGRHGLSFSVRSRITAAVALLTALALAGAGLLVFTLGRADINDRVSDQIDKEMAEFAQFAKVRRAAGVRSIPDLVTGFLSSNLPGTSELMVGFWDGGSQRWSFSERGDLAKDPRFATAVGDRVTTGGAETIATEWGPVYLDVQPLEGVNRDGAFVVAHFLDDDREALNRTMRTYAIAALLALALVTAVAAQQAGRLLRPVRVLRQTAEEIEEGDLSRRIPETGNDDITDLTRTVNAMLARLERAFAGQRAFLDDAGHELRTPLTVLRGHLELLDTGDTSDVERTRALLLDELDRMSRLVDDLITLAKADRPDFVRCKPVDIGPLVDSALVKARALGDRAWVLDENAEVEAEIDQQRITQALLQLADNAVKHTVPGDTIGFGARAVDADLELWVRDTGHGVADEHKQVVFERFGRGQVAEHDEGFGLGLSIVSAIVEGHAGTVRVLDETPKGARFVITVPLRRGSPWPGS